MNLDPRAMLLGKYIVNGTLAYSVAVTSRPDLKNDIDAYLTSVGREDLIEDI